MNREIKFRAWDKIKKEMILNDSFFELQKWNRTEKELENLELMQYTGLKDKNGKEIYEGDVVYQKDGFGNINYSVIVFAYGGFISMCTCHYPDGDMESIDADNSEVIGNIYENPDLLKQIK